MGLTLIEITGHCGDDNGEELTRLGLLQYSEQREVLTEMLDFLGKGGGMKYHYQILLVGMLKNLPQTNELLSGLTDLDKENLFKILERDIGWVKDFKDRNGLSRMVSQEQKQRLLQIAERD
ncbi:MAG: hypothetical protein Fur0024_4860 [Patescibacteria group bacterium]